MVLLSSCAGPTPSGPLSPTGVAPAESSSPSPSSVPSASASPVPSPSPTPAADLTRAPFTILVLGGDTGLRTDSLIVAGIDPTTRRVTYASLPRDTIDVPLTGGGKYGPRKVNSFYNFAASDPGSYPQGPGAATKEMMGSLLGIDIDYYALTTFAGF